VIDGVINPDVEAIYRRQSRTPVNLSLDLRAAVAGIGAAQRRIASLLARYGASTVKAVMNRMLEVSEESFRTILRTLPDGTWSERAYNEVAISGGRGSHRWELHLRKEDERVTFSNHGTEAQTGAMNLTFGGWRGGTLGALNVLMASQQMGCIGGALRAIGFDPVPGTLSCADFGAAVSPAGVYTVELAVAMANSVISKMLLASDDAEVRARAMTSSCSQWHLHHHAGTNQRGDFYIGPMLDMVIGTTGATSERDGEFANGLTYIPEGRGPNVETYERDWPILYLYRRRDNDSAGAGRHCGGAGGRIAYVPHRGEITVGLYTAEGIPKTPALGGGLPGNTGETRYLVDSDIRDIFAAGRIPASFDEVSGREEIVFGKGAALTPTQASVLEWNWGGSAGFGDPLLRDPDLVRADVRDGVFSAAVAAREFGVALDPDAARTDEWRRQARRERLRAVGVTSEPLELGDHAPPEATRFGDVWLDEASGDYRCVWCGTPAGALEEHPKALLARCDSPIATIGPRFSDPSRFVDDEIEFRAYYCCGCGTRHATEVARRGDSPLVEMRLAPAKNRATT
jgi:N-methylhydantoinase B